MTENKYKTKRIIDGKSPLRTVIVDENGKVIDKNPTNDELKNIVDINIKKFKEKYNRTGVCCVIENGKTCKNMLSPQMAYAEYDENGISSGRYICRHHWRRLHEKKPDSWNNKRRPLLKMLAQCRSGDIDPDSPQFAGRVGNSLTEQLFGVKDLDIENDNYTIGTPVDHDSIPDGLRNSIVSIDGKKESLVGKIPTSKCSRLLFRYDKPYKYCFDIGREHKKKLDIVICYCANEVLTKIEKILIIPIVDLKGVTGIAIIKNSRSNRKFKYTRYETCSDLVEQANTILPDILKMWGI